jgi:hypothetical protein
VLKCADADICEKRETLDVTILIRRVLGHLHIALTDCLALDTAKVGGLFLGVFTDDPHNREAISGDQVGISRVLNRTGHRGRAIQVQVHSHTLNDMVQPERERGEQVRERANRTDGKKEKVNRDARRLRGHSRDTWHVTASLAPASCTSQQVVYSTVVRTIWSHAVKASVIGGLSPARVSILFFSSSRILLTARVQQKIYHQHR